MVVLGVIAGSAAGIGVSCVDGSASATTDRTAGEGSLDVMVLVGIGADDAETVDVGLDGAMGEPAACRALRARNDLLK